MPIGHEVLRLACDAFSQICAQGLELGFIAVNVSARQFYQDDFLERTDEILRITGMKPKHLEMELTESAFFQDLERTRRLLNELRNRGIHLAIDDFGTGFSSMSYLKRFPLDTLKIDQSFVRDIHENEDDMAIVRAIIALARVLKLDIVAEGVETEEHRNILTQEGCNYLQGYYYARPVPVRDFIEYLKGVHAH